MSQNIRFAVFQYDIPEAVDFPNPTGYLRARNNAGKVFAFKTQYSMWLVDRDNPPLALQNRMEKAGCTVDLYPLDPCDNAKYLARAAEQMKRDIEKAKKTQEKSLREADNRLEEAERDFNNGVIGWDRLNKARRDHAKHRENALGRMEQLVKDLEAACEQFGIAKPDDALKSARNRVAGIRALGSRRAELYVELANAVKGTAMEAAAREAEVPAGILMDYAEERGHDVSSARVAFAEPTPAATATVTAPPAPKAKVGITTPRFKTNHAGLSYSKTHKSFTGEASTLNLQGAPAVIELESHVTGKVVRFTRGALVRNNDGDIIRVDYNAGQITLHLLND